MKILKLIDTLKFTVVMAVFMSGIMIMIIIPTIIIVAMMADAYNLSTYPAIVHDTYKEGHCSIQQSEVVVVSSSSPRHNKTIHYVSYGVRFQYVVLVSGTQSVPAYRYSWLQDRWESGSLDQAQAIANQYQPEHTYRCWFDPTQPEQAALMRNAPQSLITRDYWIDGIVVIVVCIVMTHIVVRVRQLLKP